MLHTDLEGPYPLDKKTIDSVVSKTSPGVFVLGYVGIGGFIPKYVGRSDDNVSLNLKEWTTGKYSKFKFDYLDTAQKAFVKECCLYHDWHEQLDNEKHPEKPVNTDCACPECNA